MNNSIERIHTKDWNTISSSLQDNGYALVANVLQKEECKGFIEEYTNANLYRKTITMERYRFGKGEYKYFNYPLPSLLTAIRQTVYPYLARVANKWMEVLSIPKTFPLDHEELKKQCHEAGQTLATPLILQYQQGGFNTLHQDLYGEIYFPFQSVLFLNEPGEDYTGGEFVLLEQIPRAQSKAIVLQPNRGDMLIFTTNFRPVKGSKGYYRATMKHGVSPVQEGKRHTLGIIFHDAKN